MLMFMNTNWDLQVPKLLYSLRSYNYLGCLSYNYSQIAFIKFNSQRSTIGTGPHYEGSYAQTHEFASHLYVAIRINIIADRLSARHLILLRSQVVFVCTLCAWAKGAVFDA